MVQKLEGIVVGGALTKDDKRLTLLLNSLRAIARFMAVAHEEIDGAIQELLWKVPDSNVCFLIHLN